jgi:hypothetical protein
VYNGAPRIYERTLAHENIRKQGKFPDIAEISLGKENAGVALDSHFVPAEENVRIWSNIVRAFARAF